MAVWPLEGFSQPLIERPSNFGASNPRIVFDSASRRILVGPSGYSLKDNRPDPQNETAVLFDLSLAVPSDRPVNIDLGDQKENCTTNKNSCYKLDYTFSPDGAWLGVSRSQSFGPPGPASVWSLGVPPSPRLNFPAGKQARIRSHITLANGVEQRRAAAMAARCKFGKLAGSGTHRQQRFLLVSAQRPELANANVR